MKERIQTDQGIVLKRIRTHEHDAHVVLFLKSWGKVMVKATGGQRFLSKNKSLLEPFSHCDYQVYFRSTGTQARLMGGKILNSFQGLRQNVQAFQVACQCCEVVDRLIPFRGHSEEAFDILGQTLERLPFSHQPQVEWMYFLVNLLKVLGHGDLSNSVSPSNLSRSMALVRSRLDHLLERPLKSEGLLPSLP